MARQSSSPQPDASITPIERVLAIFVAAMVGLAIVSFVAVLIASASGVAGAQFATGMWPTVVMFPLFALPAGFLALVALLIINWRRRRRQSAS